MHNNDQLILDILNNPANFGYHDLTYLDRTDRTRFVQRLRSLGIGKERVVGNLYAHVFRVNIYNLKKKKRIILFKLMQDIKALDQQKDYLRSLSKAINAVDIQGVPVELPNDGTPGEDQ